MAKKKVESFKIIKGGKWVATMQCTPAKFGGVLYNVYVQGKLVLTGSAANVTNAKHDVMDSRRF